MYSSVHYLFRNPTHCAFFKFYYRLLSAEYTLVRLFSLPAETVRHFWLPPRLSCFLPRLMCMINGSCRDYPREAGNRITRTVSVRSFSYLLFHNFRNRVDDMSQKGMNCKLNGEQLIWVKRNRGLSKEIELQASGSCSYEMSFLSRRMP